MNSKLILPLVILLFAHASPILAADALDEKGFQKLMKEAGDIAKRFKGNQEQKNGAELAKDTGRLAEIYKATTPFWKNRKVDDAAKWSGESETSARAAAVAAKAGDWDKVKTDLGATMKNCKNCHEAHREKLDDGTYRIK